jgi:hypothetical protein
LSGCELAEGAVRPGGVVVAQVLGQYLAQMALVDDEQPVEKLTAQGPLRQVSRVLVQVSGTQPALSAWETCPHYDDSRGVVCICPVSLNDDVWKLWRGASGFWQRYTGCSLRRRQDDQGRAWEGSAEGSQRKHGCGLNYVRPG